MQGNATHAGLSDGRCASQTFNAHFISARCGAQATGIMGFGIRRIRSWTDVEEKQAGTAFCCSPSATRGMFGSFARRGKLSKPLPSVAQCSSRQLGKGKMHNPPASRKKQPHQTTLVRPQYFRPCLVLNFF